MNICTPSFPASRRVGQALCLVAIIAIGLCFAQSLFAQTATNPAATVSTTATGLVSVSRDPFWPVGYRPKSKEVPIAPVIRPDTAAITPPPTVPVVAPAKPEPRWPELRLRGLVKNAQGGYIAVVEPFGMVELGQTLELKRDGFVYRWTVSAISEKGATCSRLNARAQ